MKLEFPGAVPEIPVRDINEAAAYDFETPESGNLLGSMM